MANAKYTMERFFEHCDASSEAYVRKQCEEGEQFVAEEVPLDALPCVVILAALGNLYGIEVADDYARLMGRFSDSLSLPGGERPKHNDLHFASAVYIMYERYQEPGWVGFSHLGIYEFWEELFGFDIREDAESEPPAEGGPQKAAEEEEE